MKSLGENPTQQELYEMIKEVDTDGNGSIDFEEFLSLMARKIQDTDTEEELLGAFKLCDRDGSGAISPEELKLAMESLGETFDDDEIAEIM